MISIEDDKFHRLEAAGLNAIIDGLSTVLRDDEKCATNQHCLDGVMPCLSKAQQKECREPAEPKAFSNKVIDELSGGLRQLNGAGD